VGFEPTVPLQTR